MSARGGASRSNGCPRATVQRPRQDRPKQLCGEQSKGRSFAFLFPACPHQFGESSRRSQRRRPAQTYQGRGIGDQRAGQPLVDFFSAGCAKQEFEQHRGERKNIRPAPEPVAHGRDHFRDRQRLRIGGNERSLQRTRCCQHDLDCRQQIFQREQRAARPEAAERQSGQATSVRPYCL
jgi:hypothetical protein